MTPQGRPDFVALGLKTSVLFSVKAVTLRKAFDFEVGSPFVGGGSEGGLESVQNNNDHCNNQDGRVTRKGLSVFKFTRSLTIMQEEA